MSEELVIPSYNNPDEGVVSPSNQSPQSFTVPSFVNDIGSGEAALIGLGRGFTKAGQGVKDTALALGGLFSDKIKAKKEAYRKQLAEEDKLWNQGLGNDLAPNSGYANVGSLVGQVLPGVALPVVGKNAIRRALATGGLGALYEGVTTAGTGGDKLAAAGLGAVGGAGGSLVADTVLKGTGAALKKYTQPDAIKRAEALRSKFNLRPRLGDVLPPNSSPNLRAAETMLAHSPLGSTSAADDVEALRRMIVPNKATGENAVLKAITETEKHGQGITAKADAIWEPFKTFVQSNKVPGVRPVELQKGLRTLLKHDASFLKSISDDVLRKNLEDLVTTPSNKLRAIPVEDYVDINSKLSGLTPYIKAKATPAPGATTIADKDTYARFSKHVLDGMRQDLDVWKTFRSPQARQAQELLDAAQREWKTEILPWKDSDVVHGLRKLGRDDAPSTARLLSGNPDTDAVARVRDLLGKYGPYDSDTTIDALLAMNRQGRVLGEVQDPMKSLEVFRGTGPQLVGATMSRNPTFQRLYLGDPLMDSTTGNVVRGGLSSLGRETGAEQASVIGAILDILGGVKDDERTSNDPNYQHGVGHATQAGVAGR